MLKTSLPPDNSAALEQAIAAVAATMADPSRVKMLCALMDGRAWTATELSAAADVAPSTDCWMESSLPACRRGAIAIIAWQGMT